jgi:ABC-type polysaccharide/polyol phosphate transport system ATPase subunit
MIAVQFDHVSKRFTLHHERPRSFQELFLSALRRQRIRSKERYLALNDVSFEIERGEMVGLIGPNGAGKSTILKLISRIIEPTCGQVQANGRIGALLELGAGFHPDLTGRENIYLNGSIQGLSRKEIQNQLDNIVGFAELERFIDVPLKHYSSGMTVRLGFSVAAHTHPEILLIDEVLAVGDAAFHQKCLDKIAEFRRGDCTILFVSHHLEAVQELCNRAVWLEQGQVQKIGEAEPVVASYLADVGRRREARSHLRNTREPDTSGDQKEIRICKVSMVDPEGKPRWTFRSGEPLSMQITYECRGRVEVPIFSILIHREDGIYVTAANTLDVGTGGSQLPPIDGPGCVELSIESLQLARGAYLLSVGAYGFPDPPFWSHPADFHDRAYHFYVESDRHTHGLLALNTHWSLRSWGELG